MTFLTPTADLPQDGDYTVDIVIDVGAWDTEANIPASIILRPGSSGYTEAQMDEAVQKLVDHLSNHHPYLHVVGARKIMHITSQVVATDTDEE